MTTEQIQKLKSLGELYNNGTITTDEFNLLKSEILNFNSDSDYKLISEERTIIENSNTYAVNKIMYFLIPMLFVFFSVIIC